MIYLLIWIHQKHTFLKQNNTSSWFFDLRTDEGTTSLINLNEETEDIMKIVKFLKESGLLTKGSSKAIESKSKEQKGGFPSILLGILKASLSANLL